MAIDAQDTSGDASLPIGFPAEAKAAAQTLVQQGQALLQAGRVQEALAEALRAQALDPSGVACRVLQGAALLGLEDSERAERDLRRACEEFPQEAQLWELLAEASWKLARQGAAAAAIDRALALAPSGRLAARKARMLLATGDLAGAEALTREAIARYPDRRSAYNVLVDACMEAARWTEAAEAAKRACAEAPTDFEMRLNWALCLLASGRPGETIAVVEDALHDLAAVPVATAYRLLLQKGEAHRLLGHVAASVDALRKAIALRPDDETAVVQLAKLHPGLAKPYRARLVEIQARRLPARLADGLKSLWERARDKPLESRELAWAWELADKSNCDRSEWLVAATWGREASLLLGHWWISAPQESRQIDAFLDEPDLSEVLAATSGGRPCLLVGAHVGPMAAAINMLEGKLTFKTYGGNIRDRLGGATLIPATSNRFAAMRALVDELRKGTTIGLMGDVPRPREALSHEFLGRQVYLPALVPRLIQTCDLPSFWCCPLWRNGRIVLELERLPDPSQGEPRDAWSRRWFIAYLGKLERVMRGAPENLGLYSGIWTNANPPDAHRPSRVRPL